MNSNYRINEFAKRVGRSVQTVRRWEKEGKLTAKRLPSGHRYFDESDVRAILGIAPEKKDIVVYCRVSSAGQKDDLASQVRAMEEYCRGAGVPVDVWMQEVGDKFYRANGDVLQADHNAALNVLARLDDPDISRFTPYREVRRILLARSPAQLSVNRLELGAEQSARQPSADKSSIALNSFL
jgi:predicted site-specific integrase-resolvase